MPKADAPQAYRINRFCDLVDSVNPVSGLHHDKTHRDFLPDEQQAGARNDMLGLKHPFISSQEKPAS
jgi:hypothetical protein